jgi:sugar transferase EpsL
MIKRGLDIVFGAFSLVVAFPLLVVASIGVFCTLGRPILFKQKRVGKNGELFEIYKLRTMRDPDSSAQSSCEIERSVRLTRVLRAWSLDELPQFWNVLKGEMSLVGPRPLLPEYLPLYTKEQARRHSVKPGITGWAQINGRNGIPWDEKFELDIWYVDNQSFWLDCKIVMRSVIVVILKKGISSDAEISMPKFKGSRS